MRFFEYLVDVLSRGQQPDPALVGDAGYIMRSTAFYANGKFGMRSFHGYAADHPLAARELALARVRARPQWDRNHNGLQ